MLHAILHNPRRLWLRKALFQVHLWLGVLLALYVIVISLSGAILVFEDDLRVAALSNDRYDAAHVAPVQSVIAQAQERFPTQRLTFISYPYKENPRWSLFLEERGGKSQTIYANAATGAPEEQASRLFVDWVSDLHIYLLAGRTGFLVNCAMGIGLLILALSGLALWWPGIKLWRRGLRVSLKHRWKRINYDLHSAIGFWTLFIVSWWGFTAVCFLFPQQVKAVVNVVLPLKGMQEPVAPEPPASPEVASLDKIIALQRQLSPGFLSGVSLPAKPGGNVILYIDRRSPGDFSHRDVDTFNGHTGALLTSFHYGQNQTLGDWLLWLVYPLHFGNLWGLPLKILWSLLGLGLAALSITGLLMYWNRSLSKRWRSLSRSNTASQANTSA